MIVDTGTAIVGAISLVFCASPFILTSINRKKREKAILTVLKKLAEKHSSKITQYEVCGSYAIGIDTANKTVSFVTQVDNNYKEQFVELSAIIDCKIGEIKRSTKNGKIIQRLYLQLSYTKQMKQEDVLEFYNADVSYQLSGELDSIEKWNKEINHLLNS